MSEINSDIFIIIHSPLIFIQEEWSDGFMIYLGYFMVE